MSEVISKKYRVKTFVSNIKDGNSVLSSDEHINEWISKCEEHLDSFSIINITRNIFDNPLAYANIMISILYTFYANDSQLKEFEHLIDNYEPY